jgi:hypothetical protein
MLSNKVCVKCFQFLHENEEKMHKRCFPISHPPVSINIETNFPVSVVMEVLKRANIKVHNSSSSTMTMMDLNPQQQFYPHHEAKVEEIQPNIYPVRGEGDSSDSSEEEESDFDDPDDENKPNFKFLEKKKSQK